MKPSTAAPAEWLPPNIEARQHSLARGEILFRKDDPTAGLYQVKQGQVRLSRVDHTGREVVLHAACAGGLIAEASLFAQVYQCDAVAMTDATVRLYPKDALLAELRQNPEALAGFAAGLAHELMALRARLELRNIRSARERVETYLALNTGADGRTIALRGTAKALAAELGLTHEALYRTLSTLQAEGIIARTKDAIILKMPSV
ncbi:MULTISPECIES: Crp/Fnr family transcriptional regulator [unclassified Mesorhizobium]|uniref:Crp/Fnr family transcriptional regulator n=1 Tax=unclassified Mesorhizobium TaxID=325217 RepID=UPI00142F1E73|nr:MULTISPECIES: Crp/Fnr family transcriptional regulator [unclassified Mesorhizobium]